MAYGLKACSCHPLSSKNNHCWKSEYDFFDTSDELSTEDNIMSKLRTNLVEKKGMFTLKHQQYHLSHVSVMKR